MRMDRSLTADVSLAAGVATLTVLDALLGEAHPTAVDLVLVVAGSSVLAARRRAPRTVLLACLLCILGYTVHAGPGPIATVPVLIGVYTVASTGHRVFALAVVVPLMVFAFAGNLAKSPGAPLPQAVQAAILPVGWFIVAFVLGEMNRHRRAHLEEARQRAAEAERTREALALRRADEERLRIARELHDSLTHTISVIKVQAGVAVHLARKRGEPVPEALVAVQEASREAMYELRATLEVLRDRETIGLDRLPALVERAGTAGPPVTLTTDGPRRALPADVDQAAYRIVQEALTNVARHANATKATVHLGYGPQTLLIRVDDNGTAAPDVQPEPGTGLAGMRERVTALGGRLSAHARSEGGFTVEAELPVDAA